MSKKSKFQNQFRIKWSWPLTSPPSTAGLSPGDPGPSAHLPGQQRRIHPVLHLQNSQQLPEEVPVPAVHR